jgi:hypothetical protein
MSSDTSSGTQSGRQPADWQRRGLITVLVVILLVISYFVARSWLPRWWASVAANLSNREFGWGLFWGLLIGFAFTVTPLFVARLALRRGLEWRSRGWRALGALVLAGPNLMTLGVVTGSSDGAHAGHARLGRDAPAFTGSTLAGVIGGAVASVAVFVFLARHSRQRKELSKLRVEEKLRRANEN